MKIGVSLFVLSCFVFAGMGCVSTLNVADQNFEKARSLRLRNRPDASKPLYETAAKNYEKLFRAKAKEGRTPFLSSRLKAGMSLYWAGQSQQAYDLFDKLFQAGDTTLETLVYGGLSAAALGKKDAAVSMWATLDETHEAYIIHMGIAKALAGLDEGSLTLGKAADVVRDAIITQDRKNILQQVTASAMLNPEDTCSGRFWWRHNESTCSADIRPGDGF